MMSNRGSGDNFASSGALLDEELDIIRWGDDGGQSVDWPDLGSRRFESASQSSERTSTLRRVRRTRAVRKVAMTVDREATSRPKALRQSRKKSSSHGGRRNGTTA